MSRLDPLEPNDIVVRRPWDWWMPIAGGDPLTRPRDAEGLTALIVCRGRENALWWAGWWSDWTKPIDAWSITPEQWTYLDSRPGIRLVEAQERAQAEVLWLQSESRR